MDPNHPKQSLVFVIIDGDRPRIDVALERALESLRQSRTWTIGPPELVEFKDEGRVGGLLELYSALPPWGQKLPKNSDAAQFEEVSDLVCELQKLSAAYSVEIEFELDGIDVGGIHSGKVTSSLSDGLLGEWKRILEERA